MYDVFQEAEKQLKLKNPFVISTVIKTKGSTPQKPGAKLLVSSSGDGTGTLGGGCVEGDIWFESEELIKNNGSAFYRDYILNEDLAANDGLVCGGTMYFLLDPLDQSSISSKYVSEINNAYTGGPAVLVATLIKPSIDNNLPIGSKLFIREDGTSDGTLGSLEADSLAVIKSEGLMDLGNNEFVLTQDGTEFFMEAYTSPPQVILVGGGHVSKAISPLVHNLGFRITVTDDRYEFANRERFSEAENVLVADPKEAFKKLKINKNSYVLIATRGHKYDNLALEMAVNTSARYVGLLGSKRKAILILRELVDKGIPIERVREVRSPAGLNIHARTPDEIAISIVSEMLLFRLGGDGSPMKLDESYYHQLTKNQV